MLRQAAGQKKGYRFSYDMLGEGARTDADADRYFSIYREALGRIALQSQQSTAAGQRPGLSVKLSALHPRFQPSQEALLQAELAPRLLSLAQAMREGLRGPDRPFRTWSPTAWPWVSLMRLK